MCIGSSGPVYTISQGALPFIVVGLLLLACLLWIHFGMKPKSKKEKKKFKIMKIAVLALSIIMFLIVYLFYITQTYLKCM